MRHFRESSTLPCPRSDDCRIEGERGRSPCESLFEDFDADLRDTRGADPDDARCAIGKIDDATPDEGAPVIDADHDGPSIGKILYANFRAERQRSVRGGETARIETFAVCGDFTAAVVGRDSDLSRLGRDGCFSRGKKQR